MNITVINGSPKGEYSITLQTLKYLEIKYSDHNFSYLNAGRLIGKYERDFTEARDMLTAADILVFSYPVYTFLAPSQLHRFIELIKASGVDLSGKIATSVTTSKHFYDVTAHKYVEENCHDLGMNYVRGLSADMEDLLCERGRAEAEKFFDFLLWSVGHRAFTTLKSRTESHIPNLPDVPTPVERERSGNVVVITDCTDENSSLYKMIARFRESLDHASRIVNISDLRIDGGCLGCFNCAVSAKCVYKDGFDEFLRTNIQASDAIVYAFTISDHSMGSRFKRYDDRNFCNGHRTVTVGTPVAYLISGPYSEEDNLRTVIEARCDTGGNFLAGVATDEGDTNSAVDIVAATLDFALNTGHTAPQSFYGVGGMKIFRDLIYEMRGMMRADHKFYKSHGQYDFPQMHKLKSLKMYLVGALLSSEKIRKKLGNKMNEGMLMPYKKLFSKLEKENNKKS